MFEPGTEEFWGAARAMRGRPDLQRRFLAGLARLSAFEDPRRLELLLPALAHSPEFFSWPDLQMFRTHWLWRKSHSLDLMEGDGAALRRVHAVLIPHYRLLTAVPEQSEGCTSGGVSVFPVNFRCDEPAREALRGAADELLWLVGTWGTSAPLIGAALGSSTGMEAWRCACAVLSAAKEARKTLPGNCIGIVIEGGGLLQGNSLGLGVLLCMLGDLVFKERSGIPRQWRENIAHWVSTGALDRHRVKPVGWIGPKGDATEAANRPLLAPVENAELKRNQHAVHSVPDAVRKVTGFRRGKLLRNVAAPGVAFVVVSGVGIGIRIVEPGQLAFTGVQTALPTAVRDGIDILQVYGSPAILDIAVRNSKDDGRTVVRARAMQKNAGPRIRFFTSSPDKLAEEMEAPVVDGRARIGIEFPYLEAAIVELSIIRKGAVRSVHVWKVEKR